MIIVRRVLAVSLFVALLVAGWSFERGNTEVISIHYLIGTTGPVPIWLVVVCAFGGGLILSAAYLGVALLRDRVEIGRLRRVVRKLEGELKDFRNKPLRDALEPGATGHSTTQLTPPTSSEGAKKTGAHTSLPRAAGRGAS